MQLAMGTSFDVSLVSAFSTLVALVFLFSLDFLCLFNDESNSEHAHNRHTRGGGRDGGKCKGFYIKIIIVYTHILII